MTNPDEEVTNVRHETPFELVLRELVEIAGKVDALKAAVEAVTNERLDAHQLRVEAQQLRRRVEIVEERCPLCLALQETQPLTVR